MKRQAHNLILGAWLFGMVPQGFAQEETAAPADAPTAMADAEAPAAPKGAPVTSNTEIKGQDLSKPEYYADGTRITVKGGDFSIKAPKGWEVFTKLDNLTLLMQVPKRPGMKYQRTIQVASFSEPR